MMVTTPNDSPLQKALFALTMVACVLVVLAFVTAVVTLVLHGLNNPDPPECLDDASHERSWSECEHPDHRMVVEGEYAICRCPKDSDGY